MGDARLTGRAAGTASATRGSPWRARAPRPRAAWRRRRARLGRSSLRGLDEPRRAGADRRRQLAGCPGPTLDRQGAERRQRVVQVAQRRAAPPRASGASSRIEAERLADSAASAPAVVLKLVIRSLSDPSVEASLANRSRWPRIRLERSCGCWPSSASLTIAVVAARLAAVAEGLVDRLRRRSRPGRRVLGGVLGGGRLVVERRCRSPQRPLQARRGCPSGARSGPRRAGPRSRSG